MKLITEQILASMSEIGRMIREQSGGNPVSTPQFESLRFIKENERPTMHDLARHLKIRAPSATFMVEELASGGLVRRVRDESDRRQVRLAVSPRGRRIFSQALESRMAAMEKIIGRLNARDQKELLRILNKMTAKR